jgi:hypothetical protein
LSVPGGATGDESTQQNPPNQGGDGKPSGDQGGDGTGAGKPGAGGEPTQEKTFTQAEVNALIDDRLKRERDKNDRDAAEAKQKADATTLAEQKKYQELSETLQTQLDGKGRELTSTQEQLEAANKALQAHLEALRKDIPPHIITLLDRMTPAEQLTYIAANADELKPKPANNGSSNGSGQQQRVPNTPNPGGAELTDEERRKQAAPARSFW